jgi:hypothetical protein
MLYLAQIAPILQVSSIHVSNKNKTAGANDLAAIHVRPVRSLGGVGAR